jgi:predicted metalloprotease with PDZ domain
LAARDLRKVARSQKEVWDSLPVEHYTFFNILSGKGGGMEHTASTVMMASHDATKRRDTYVRWLNLASHELFHLWNVKRLRPREIAPGEYEEEQYTPSLGIAEGFTTYYAPVTLRRAGVITEDEFREEMRRRVESVQAREGRKIQTLAESSFDTWIKFASPSERLKRTTIDYYDHGAVVGMLLDARIRAATNGAKSLDHAMRLALERYPRERGYTLDEFRAAASEVAATDLTDWFLKAFHSTNELDYREAERVFGFKLTR